MIDRRSFLKCFAGAGAAFGGSLQLINYEKLSAISPADNAIQSNNKESIADIVNQHVTTALSRFYDTWWLPGLIGVDLMDLLTVAALPGIICMGEASFLHSYQMKEAFIKAIRHPFLGEAMLRKAKGVILSIRQGRHTSSIVGLDVIKKHHDDLHLFTNGDAIVMVGNPIDNERDESTITIFACGIEMGGMNENYTT